MLPLELGVKLYAAELRAEIDLANDLQRTKVAAEDWRVATYVFRFQWPYWVAVMLARCSNPSCFAVFRHLDKGTLFRLEPEAAFPSDKLRRTEYFWLCDRCSENMTLALAEEQRVIAVPLPEQIRGVRNSVSLVSRDRRRGLLLRSISFLSEHFDDRTGTRSKARHHAA
jgi:hypothetical protein